LTVHRCSHRLRYRKARSAPSQSYRQTRRYHLMRESPAIPGYTYATDAVAKSPVSLGEFEQMKQSVLFGDDDIELLRKSHDVLNGLEEEILDVWYGFVASTPHLVASF